MRRLAILLAPVLAAACSSGGEPTWAYDPITVTPDGDGVYAVHTWQLYAQEWEKKNSDRHYVCAVLVELAGAPIPCDAEPDCELAWAVSARLLESDCAGTVMDDPLFVSAQRLALGGPAAGDVPWPGQTLSSYVDYGLGWELHGHAYPEALDHGESTSGTWDGVEPFLWVPTLAFPLP